MTLIDRRLLVARVGRWQWYWGLLGIGTLIALIMGIVLSLVQATLDWPELSFLVGLAVDKDVFLSPRQWSSFVEFVVGAVPVILATWVTIRWVHGWSVGRVLGPGNRFVWAHFGKAAAALFVLSMAGTAIDFVTDPAQYTLRVVHWPILFWIVLAGVVILPQAFSEDFLFNGYLMRLWGAVVPIRFVVPILLSLLFSLAHLGNEDAAKDPWPSHAALFGGQLLSLLIYVRTGSLGATVGLHWMNNLFVAALVGTEPGYRNDLALMIYRDPVLIKGGSYLYDPWSWLSLVVGLLIVWLCLSWRRSPFYIPDRVDVPPALHASEAGHTFNGSGIDSVGGEKQV